jgi:hypothetical protein
MVERRHPRVNPELEQLARDINAELDGIKNGLRTNARRAVKMGALLNQAKRAVGYGRFCKWCKKNFRISSRQLQKYMRLAEYSEQHPNANQTSDLEVILEGGFEAALRSFQVREEDLPATPQAACVAPRSAVAPAPVALICPLARESRSRRIWIQGELHRADQAIGLAVCHDCSRHRELIDDAMVDRMRIAAEKWTKKYKYYKQQSVLPSRSDRSIGEGRQR